MHERSTEPDALAVHAPLGAANPAPVVTPTVDKFPKSPAEWAAFAALPAPERSAVYLRSIRAMLLFFTVLVVIGLTATIALMVIGMNSGSDTTTVNTNPFG